MPQNILKNQIALAASSPSTGLNRNNNSSFSSSSCSSYSPKILNEQQNQYHNPSKAFSISNNNNNNNNNSTTNNTTFSSNSISRLNQGKLIFLNEKFSHKSENNYDELITNTTINKPHINSNRSKNKKDKCHKEDQDICQCCHLSQDIKTSTTPTASGNIKLRKAFTHGESTQKKRLSCEELEDLSERFADFIKIDATTMSQQQKLKCKAPPPPPPHSPPLPPPPPDLLHNNDNNMDLNCTGRTGLGKRKKNNYC
jgi:hypothetical protein